MAGSGGTYSSDCLRSHSSRGRNWGVWLRKHLFASPFQALITVLLGWLMLATIPMLLDWLVFKASFGAGDAQRCQAAGGACWSFIVDKHRLILFGTYPYDEQWRPLLASVLLVALVVVSCLRRCRRWWLPLLWLLGLATVLLLMGGGLFGLSPVGTERWGGLPLTLILSTVGIALAFPLGVVLALGRRSRLPLVKAICVIYIELIRGVPLISLLFMSSVMLPLFLPAGLHIDKLLRAQIAIVMFVAAYIAEIVRGGLQAIDRGQYEAVEALGLGPWRGMRLVILPQALTIVVPPLVSIFISLFKDTSLVVVIGIFDLTQAAKAAVADAAWRGYSAEAYLFIALIYFVFCHAISRYGRHLEGQLPGGKSP